MKSMREVPSMSDEAFWGYLQQARGTGAGSAKPEALKLVLASLFDRDVTAFGKLFYEKLCDLNRWAVWGAGFVIAGGMSDDSFHYFRSWIVGKGKEAFETALHSPDRLGGYVYDETVDNELLEYVPVELLQQRGSRTDPRDFCDRRADEAPQGERFDEETVRSNYPELAKRFR